MASQDNFRTWVRRWIRWLVPLAVLLFVISMSDWRFDREVFKQEDEFRAAHLQLNEKQRAAAKKSRTVVYAVVDIADGAVIKPDAVAAMTVDTRELPDGVVSEEDLHGANAESWYVTKTKNAIGRISKGIRKGEILFYSYPGFGGRFVIVAVKDIPDGQMIAKDSIEEKEINPCDMPVLAVSSEDEAIGKPSTGILRGQIITYESGGFGRNGRGGDTPGSNRERLPYVYAIKNVAKGSVIKDVDVRHGTYRSRGLTKGDADIALYPEGKRAKSAISAGQIIANHDLVYEDSGARPRRAIVPQRVAP